MHRTLSPIVLILTLTIPLTAAWAGDFAKSAPPTSFRGLAWGTTIEDAPHLLPVQAPGYKDTYFRTDEPLQFGNAEIVSVAYYFRKDKFYRVGVAFNGRANHFLLKDQLISRYGRGRNAGSRYGWVWPQFSIELDFDDETKSGGLYYTFEGKLD